MNGRASTPSRRCASAAASSTERDRLQQHELVAAQARERVVAVQQVAQALGDRAQQRVAGAVAERVVHQLEAVEVDAQQRELRAVARRGEDRLAGAVGEQRASWAGR